MTLSTLDNINGQCIDLRFESLDEYTDFDNYKKGVAPVDKHKVLKKSKTKIVKSSYRKKAKKMQGYTSCAATHPKLSLGSGLHIWGGSCTRNEPNKVAYDVIVGLDSGMLRTNNQYPWKDKVEFLFRIQDMGVPSDIKEFKNLLQYLWVAIKDGKEVFVGCIGGHGRTGLVLSALVNKVLKIEDSTTYVREKYCQKVVESVEQVEWLHTNFGIKKVEATKTFSYGSSIALDNNASKSYTTGWSGGESLPEVLSPIAVEGSIFRKGAVGENNS